MPVNVTIVIPCRNEEKFIAACLDTVLFQDYPKDALEVFVVDGMSTDRTREIVARYCQKFPFIKIIDNPKKFSPSAFNIGINNARGRYLAIMGAHAQYPRDYISRCIFHLEESGADNVGGVLLAKPFINSAVAASIAQVLASPLAAGGAFRRKTAVPVRADTVFGGCYKIEVFKKIGLFDERLLRSQDMELNIRLKRSGGKIMIFPDITVNYYPKSNSYDFFIHNFWDGVWAVYPAKFIKMPLKLRHYLPAMFVLVGIGLLVLAAFRREWFFVLAAALAAYVFAVLLFSLKIAIKENDWRYLFLAPVAFFIRHFAYGLGSIWGILKLALP